MVPFYEIQPSDLTVIHNYREIRFHAHLHEYIEIAYVFKEGQHIDIDGIEYEIKSGQAAVVFPDIVHYYYRNEVRPADEVLVICSPKLFNGMFPDMSSVRPKNPIITDVDETTKLAFQQIADCTSFPEKLGWSLIIMSGIMEKISLEHGKHIPVESLTQKIIQYMTINFKQDISIETLADEFSVSKYYISHIFSDRIKISFRNYLALLRTEYAASLMRTTDDSITNICGCAGFTSQRTFNRAFKQIYGVTPREYKNNISELYKE